MASVSTQIRGTSRGVTTSLILRTDRRGMIGYGLPGALPIGYVAAPKERTNAARWAAVADGIESGELDHGWPQRTVEGHARTIRDVLGTAAGVDGP